MLSVKDIVILGMMVFALFLGAGNIIFPPMEGYRSGTQWGYAALGFVLTGVFMPFVTLVIVAIRGRGEELSRDLPKWAEVAFWVTLYLVIGSTFAMPRVTNVAYEMAWLPLNLTDASNPYAHMIFAVIFNVIGMLLMLRHNTIISSVGKFMTPALLVLLIIVAVTVIRIPLSTINPPSHTYASTPALAVGLISGYQTMDVLAATAFGGIVARALAVKGVTQTSYIIKYTMLGGLFSVILLAMLYFSLFYLGATADSVAQDATNGGQIFSRYVNALFGAYGVWIMSAIVMLANLTTLVGVTSACADYFSKFSLRFSYPFWVVLFTLLTIVISEIGLTTLLRVTIPALLLIYPIAIMLVVLQLVRARLSSIKLSYYMTLCVTICFSVLDSLNNIGILPQRLNESLHQLPLYSEGLAWLLPSFTTLCATMIVAKLRSKTA